MDSDSKDSINTTELLAQLKGVQLPDAPVAAELWPVYLSITLSLVALLLFLTRYVKSRHTWHRRALQNLTKLQDQSSETPDGSLQQAAILLKRIALTVDERDSAQHLCGDAWLDYLDRLFATDFFSRGEGKVFGSALYRANARADDSVLVNLKKLVKRHRRQHA